MSNNCYRKGEAKRRQRQQHKSCGIRPDPAWTRHFTSWFRCVHCWREASSLCQCHIKVQCVVQDSSVPGQQAVTDGAACEPSRNAGLQLDKGSPSFWRCLGKCKIQSGIQRDLGNFHCTEKMDVTVICGFYMPVLPHQSQLQTGKLQHDRNDLPHVTREVRGIAGTVSLAAVLPSIS